jgi:hypothetical protein
MDGVDSEFKNPQQSQLETKLKQSGLSEEELKLLGYTKNPLLEFFQSKQDGTFGQSILELIEGFQKKDHTTRLSELIVRFIAVAVVVIAVVYLSQAGKFDPSIGVLFGTLIGYLFARSKEA